MRISTLVIAAALTCSTSPAPAQDQPQQGETLAQPKILEVPKQPVQPPKDQAQPPRDETQPPGLIQGQTESRPESVPKNVPKSQDRVQEQSEPAETSAAPKTPSRFTFTRINDNFLRLDNETGQVAYCSPHASGWACEAVPEERAALEKEIARLQQEVASLKTEVASLRAPPHPVPPGLVPPGPQAGKDADAPIKLPSSEDLARARAFFDVAWRRLIEMIENIQKDMMHKG